MKRRATFPAGSLGMLLILPQLLLVLVFFYWPTGEAFYWAFTLEPPFGGGNQWVGLDNFRQVFADAKYWDSVRTSVLFAALSTTLSLVMALVLALVVDRQLAGYKAYRFLYFWPYAVAAPAVGLAFRFIFAPDAGFISIVNHWFPGAGSFGCKQAWNPAFCGPHAMILIVLANSWKMIGYNFIFFLAGLQSIPRTVTEAAAMDGAGVTRRMWDIQLPLLAPTLFFLLVINITESFVDSFGIVDITTNGGPARATDLMVFKIYSDGFIAKDYSLAAAQSIVLMALVMALTLVQFRYIERRVHYT